MPNDTTPAPTGDQEHAAGEDWAARYKGLQGVVAKRDEALHTSTAALDALKAEHEAALLELAEHRQKVIDESEEETARQTYEALAKRFEPEPPRPLGTNPVRDWTTPERNEYLARERVERDTSTGWPIG